MTGGMMFENGKWACEHGSDDYFYVAREDGQSFSKDERKAVEKLIEAAPDLLEFAKHVQACILKNGDYAPLSIQYVHEIIAKALGEQK